MDDILITCIYISGITAALSATIFPFVYALVPWWKTHLGRAFMLRSIATAIILDLIVVFEFWPIAKEMVRLWIQAFGFTFVAFASLYLLGVLIYTNHLTPPKGANRDRFAPGADSAPE